MNNKGFTLIELIVTIALLAIIALISTPNIIKLIEKNKVDNYNGVVDSVIEGAEIYASDNRYKLDFKNDSGTIDYCKPGEDKKIYANVNLGTLIDKKNLKATTKDDGGNETIENPCNNEPISRNTVIKIALYCKTKQLSYDIDVTYSDSTLKRRKDDAGNYIDELEGIKIPDGSKCSDLY